MKYSFGVPAWLGAIKVSLVVFGVPALLAALASVGLGRWFELTPSARVAVFVVLFLFVVAGFLVTLTLRNRRAADKRSGL
jgi:hypothetical protein